MVANRANIIRSIDENEKIYKRVYKYLEAAKIIHDDIEWIYNQAVDSERLKTEAGKWIKKLLLGVKPKGRAGKERHLFGSAITFQGHIDHSETFISPMKKIHYLKGAAGTGKSTLLHKLASAFQDRGYDLELYHEPLEPEKLEAIIIPELASAFTTNPKYDSKLAFDLDHFLDMEVIEKYRCELMESERVFIYLMDNVFCNLKKAKKNHDEIETYYIPNINFHKVDLVAADLSHRILKFK
jgi:hypothetical protein